MEFSAAAECCNIVLYCLWCCKDLSIFLYTFLYNVHRFSSWRDVFLWQTVVFVKKRYLQPPPHSFCSSSPRHLREAIRTSPQPGLSESGLSLSLGWAKLPQSHRSEPARPSLPRDSISNRRDQNRPKSQKLTWPERHPYSLTLYSFTSLPSPYL